MFSIWEAIAMAAYSGLIGFVIADWRCFFRHGIREAVRQGMDEAERDFKARHKNEL